MKILGLLLIPLLASVNGFHADDGYELWDPFAIDPQEWMEDPVRNKRDPLSIFLTYEKDSCGKNTDAPKIVEMGYDDEGKKIVKKLFHAGESEGSASHKPTRITIVKACKCKLKQKGLKSVTPPSKPQSHEDPFEMLRPRKDYSTPSLGGRINTDNSEEELVKEKNIWSMTSDELMSGTYSQSSLPSDGKARPSPMASYTSKHFNSFSLTTPSHISSPIEQQRPETPQSPSDQGYPFYSFLTGEFHPQDVNEQAIIHRITSQYDLSPGESDFEQQKRIKQAVLDFIKSKYPVKVSKKRILAETKHHSY